MKKILGIALIIALAGLASCGKAEVNNDENTTVPAEEVSVEGATESEEVMEEETMAEDLPENVENDESVEAVEETTESEEVMEEETPATESTEEAADMADDLPEDVENDASIDETTEEK